MSKHIHARRQFTEDEQKVKSKTKDLKMTQAIPQQLQRQIPSASEDVLFTIGTLNFNDVLIGYTSTALVNIRHLSMAWKPVDVQRYVDTLSPEQLASVIVLDREELSGVYVPTFLLLTSYVPFLIANYTGSSMLVGFICIEFGSGHPVSTLPGVALEHHVLRDHVFSELVQMVSSKFSIARMNVTTNNLLMSEIVVPLVEICNGKHGMSGISRYQVSDPCSWGIENCSSTPLNYVRYVLLTTLLRVAHVPNFSSTHLSIVICFAHTVENIVNSRVVSGLTPVFDMKSTEAIRHRYGIMLAPSAMLL